MFCAVWGMTFFTEPQLIVAAFKSWPTTVMHISPSSVTRSPFSGCKSWTRSRHSMFSSWKLSLAP
jgi:hypothetical protein